AGRWRRGGGRWARGGAPNAAANLRRKCVGDSSAMRARLSVVHGCATSWSIVSLTRSSRRVVDSRRPAAGPRCSVPMEPTLPAVGESRDSLLSESLLLHSIEPAPILEQSGWVGAAPVLQIFVPPVPRWRRGSPLTRSAGGSRGRRTPDQRWPPAAS